jgi:hypothetical protein
MRKDYQSDDEKDSLSLSKLTGKKIYEEITTIIAKTPYIPCSAAYELAREFWKLYWRTNEITSSQKNSQDIL